MPRTIEDVLPPGRLGSRDQPQVRTEQGLVLRPWRAEDAEVVREAFRDPDIERWHLRTLPEGSDATAWIEACGDDWAAERGASWAVTAGDGRVLGQVALRGVNLAMGVTQVSYWVLPEARRQGVATAALQALSDWALQDVGFHRVWLMHSTRNRPSCVVAEATGHQPEGTLREALLHADGWHDMHVHGRVASRQQHDDRPRT